MAPASRLGRQISELAATLRRLDAQFALIDGLALASHNVIRATQDVDLLVALEKADEIEGELVKLGYQCLHRDSNAGNYARSGERVDFLYASRPIARRLLADAKELSTSLGSLRVISAEGLIGPSQPFAEHAGFGGPATLDGDPYRTLDDLMVVVEALCPVWPECQPFVASGKMLL